MRGDEQMQAGFIVMTSLEDVVPGDHLLRAILALVDSALAQMSPALKALHASGGRPVVDPASLRPSRAKPPLGAPRSRNAALA